MDPFLSAVDIPKSKNSFFIGVGVVVCKISGFFAESEIALSNRGVAELSAVSLDLGVDSDFGLLGCGFGGVAMNKRWSSIIPWFLSSGDPVRLTSKLFFEISLLIK
jgi:hypothetical protein